MTVSGTDSRIATSSVEEALDFACALLVDALRAVGRTRPERAPRLLVSLTQNVRLRYAGEFRLAFEELLALGEDVGSELRDPSQYHAQMAWLRNSLGSGAVWQSDGADRDG